MVENKYMRLSEIAEFIVEHNQDCRMYYNNNVVKVVEKIGMKNL